MTKVLKLHSEIVNRKKLLPLLFCFFTLPPSFFSFLYTSTSILFVPFHFSLYSFIPLHFPPLFSFLYTFLSILLFLYTSLAILFVPLHFSLHYFCSFIHSLHYFCFFTLPPLSFCSFTISPSNRI